jgi:hypothetical protein
VSEESRETGQATGGLHPDAVPADCRVALWPFHGEIVVDSGLPRRMLRGLEMPNRKSRLEGISRHQLKRRLLRATRHLNVAQVAGRLTDCVA